jgi:ornithine cyclodeaminase
MLILTRNDLQQAVTMADAMDAVAGAFAQLSSGEAAVPLRTRIELPGEQGVALFMPAYLHGANALGLKALTLLPHNTERRGLPAIAAVVLVFDAENGQPSALMDGGYLTALRTGAASGVATRLMARADARTLALFGAGAQALPQVLAVCVARPIERVWLVNRTRERAERLAAELRAFGPPIPTDVRVATSAREALAETDVVCAATASSTPLFAAADLRPGTHINAIGAYTGQMREVPAAAIAQARIVVDQREAAWAEAGDLILARDEGAIGADHVAGELGEVVLGRIAGRTSPEEITCFKSVGNAVQDVAVARVAFERAREHGLGTLVTLG